MFDKKKRIVQYSFPEAYHFGRDYDVTSMGIFSSHARGEAAADSDIDILVEFNRPIGFFKFLELEERFSQSYPRIIFRGVPI